MSKQSFAPTNCARRSVADVIRCSSLTPALLSTHYCILMDPACRNPRAPSRVRSRSVMLGFLPRNPLVVDPDQFAEAQPRVLRDGLDSPLVLGRGDTRPLGCAVDRRTGERVGIPTLQRLVAVTHLHQLAADVAEAQGRISVPDRQERQGERSLDDEPDQ